jgi:hypothetical protein
MQKPGEVVERCDAVNVLIVFVEVQNYFRTGRSDPAGF